MPCKEASSATAAAAAAVVVAVAAAVVVPDDHHRHLALKLTMYLELESDFEETRRFELVEDWLLVLSERLPTIFSEVRWLVSPRLVLCL